jgi:hypothetical protein
VIKKKDDSVPVIVPERTWLSNLFVRRPWTIALSGSAIISCYFVVFAFYLSFVAVPYGNRDYFDYSDEDTKLFDVREALVMQVKEDEGINGTMPLQSFSVANWWAFVIIECLDGMCDNIMTPDGIHFMEDVDKIINTDPMWSKVCLKDHKKNACAADISSG